MTKMTDEQRANIEGQVQRQTAELALYAEAIDGMSKDLAEVQAPADTKQSEIDALNEAKDSAVKDFDAQLSTATAELAELNKPVNVAAEKLRGLQFNSAALQTAITGCTALLE